MKRYIKSSGTMSKDEVVDAIMNNKPFDMNSYDEYFKPNYSDDAIAAEDVQVGDIIESDYDASEVNLYTQYKVLDVSESQTGYSTPDITIVIKGEVLVSQGDVNVGDIITLHYDESDKVGHLLTDEQSILDDVTEDDVTASTTMDNSAKLLDELEKATRKFMMDDVGFNRAEAFSYSTVEVHQDNSGMYCAEVRAELSYDAMNNLIDKLDPIVAKYDDNAYFEMEEPGIATAYLDIVPFDDLSDSTDSTDESDDDYPNEAPEYNEYEEREWRPGDAPWKAPGMSARDFI